MNIGENVRKLRLQKGLTQSQLAQAVNVTQGMIAQIERGTKSLSIQLGKQISQALDVDFDEIVLGI